VAGLQDRIKSWAVPVHGSWSLSAAGDAVSAGVAEADGLVSGRFGAAFLGLGCGSLFVGDTAAAETLAWRTPLP